MNLIGLLTRPVHSADQTPTGFATPMPRAKGGQNVEYWWNRILSSGDGGDGARLKEPYRMSPWIQRAIKIKAGEIASTELKFYDGENEYEETDFIEFWKAPAIGPDGQRIPISDVYEALVGWLDLKGINFIILDDMWLTPFPEARGAGKLTPFIIARPDKMRRIFANKVLVGYEYTDALSQRHALLPEQVVVNKFWNPYDPYDGLPPLDCAMNAAEGDYLAGLYVRNLMRNNGDQGVYIINEDGVPDDPQKEQIIQALREKRAAAQSGVFKPVFLGGKIKVEDAKAQSPDAAFNSTRLQNRHEVFIALGIPPSMADIVASYSIGSASDRYQLIESTCIPLGKKLAGPFSFIAARMTGLKLMAILDWDGHRVMQEVRRERITTAKDLFAMGMPVEEINEYLDLGMTAFAGWDRGYLPFSVVPVEPDGSLPEKTPPPEGTPSKDDPAADEGGGVKESFRRLRALFTKAQRVIELPPAAPADGVTKRSSKEVAQWHAHMLQRRSGEKLTHSAVTKNLMKARAQVLGNIERLVPPSESAHALALLQATVKSGGLVASLNFDKHDFAKGLFMDIGRANKDNILKAGEQLMLELGSGDPFSLPDEQVLLQLKRRTNLLSGVPDEIYDSVQRQLEEGLGEGEGRGELSNRIRGLFNDMTRGRANTIAQTETASAYGYGRKEGMNQAGVGWQQWLSSADDKVRDDHAFANGQTVPIDEPFDVGGEELMYPGDSDGGSAGNVINCRCVAIPVLEAPEENAVKRRKPRVEKVSS